MGVEDGTQRTGAPDATPGLARAAVYRRVVEASLERVWENVLDWEHLPGLHRSSFAEVECIEAGDEGWVARVHSSRGAAVIALRIDRDARKYVSHTREGRGQGAEVWTYLEPTEPDRTSIRVEFWVPDRGLPLEDVGAGYMALYARLWDEDERMMRRRAELLRARRQPRGDDLPLRLGPLDEVRASLPRVLSLAHGSFRLIELDGQLRMHATICPHALGPLEDVPVEDGVIECPWHRYRFDVRTGRCLDRTVRLRPPPRVELRDGVVWLVRAAVLRAGSPGPHGDS